MATESESSTLATTACVVADSSASGGAAIKFGTTSCTNTWPAAPPAPICSNPAYLSGPATAPAGAIIVPAGDNSQISQNWWPNGLSTPNKTFWFAPGVHTLGTDQFGQIQPGNGSTYVGAPGAIVDGQNINQAAFTARATNVTIKYLTIRNFVPPHDQSVVNHDSALNWTITNNTIINNQGAAVFAGTNNVVSYNCLKDNGQYGFQTYSNYEKPTNITLDHNEITGNNTADTENTAGWVGCGCSGGGKFWDSQDVNVTNNYVHDNRGVGLWADTLNIGFLFEGNWIENNEAQGLYYEVSYNFAIKNNVFKHNAVPIGPLDPGVPAGAIYISESGSDSRVSSPSGRFKDSSEISGNLFQDNWSAITLWENSNRFCSHGLPTSECTLVNPAQITVASCAAGLADPVKNRQTYMTPNYFNDCRWLVKNVKVHHNTFKHNPANIAGCTVQKSCGFNSMFSNYGSTAPYTSSQIPTNIAFNQGNLFSNNTYIGPWNFWGWAQSNLIFPTTFAQWQKPITDHCDTAQQVQSGTCNSGFGQDTGSTLDPTPH